MAGHARRRDRDRSLTRGRQADPIGFRADQYDISTAEALSSELGLSSITASVLARRGHHGAEAARKFLAADERHEPDLFRNIATAGNAVSQAIDRRRQITVYGDFDADGVCATAVLVGAIRELGGRCDWFIPDRIDDGYGLNPEAIRKLAARGTEFLITVDCGVTAVDEVDLARSLGLDVVVTDHHQYDSARLPDCPILHPEVSDYPFPSLCGTAVAAKLATWLRRAAGKEAAGEEDDLDLVALATVADVMPLVGENRRLVREGIEVARLARRPGMAALMEECRVSPAALQAEDFGFRLAPRVNAAGRMYRADAGVELFLSDSPERAAEIARELSTANAERRRVERVVLSAAEKELTAQSEDHAAIVVAGEGWHPGVVGIVASRLVRAHGRPAVVISLDGESGRGSARSVPGLDLHDALDDCSGELLGFGGHAAAAGLQIESSRLDSFRDALDRAVTDRIGTEPIAPEVTFDAVAGGEELGLDLIEELERVGPFGNGNRSIRLLIPGARVEDLREMGEGKHCRFTIVSGGCRAAGVRFGSNTLGAGPDDRVDLIAEPGLNHWNGSVEPRLVVEESVPLPPADSLDGCESVEWWERFDRSLTADPEGSDVTGPEAGGSERVRSTRTGPPGVRIGELISSGAKVAIISAEATRRWKALGGSGGLGRFSPEAAVRGVWEGSPQSALDEAGEATVLVTDYGTLEMLDPDTPGRYGEMVLLDPPASEDEAAAVTGGRGRLHRVAGSDEFEFALAASAHRFDPTRDLRELYRALRGSGGADASGLSGERLLAALAGSPERPRSPERAALLIRVLDQAGLLHAEGAGADRVLGVVSSVRVELSASALFTSQISIHKERSAFLRQSQRTL